MNGLNKVDLINSQIDIINWLIGDEDEAGGHISTLSVVYDSSDFDDNDHYIKLSISDFDKLYPVLAEAGISFEIVYSLADHKNIEADKSKYANVQAEAFWDNYTLAGELTDNGDEIKPEDCVFAATRLKAEMISRLLEVLEDYTKEGVKVECTVV